MAAPDDLRALIRNVPDFPKKGIVFRDITPLVLHPVALRQAAQMLVHAFTGDPVEVVVGIEARGFIIGAVVAQMLNVGLALVRKKGKLPWKTVRETYALEYGSDTVEMHTDAVRPGQRALVIDDLLATGGTARAACRLVGQLGGEVTGCGFIIELGFLKGREQLRDTKVVALVNYESE